MVFPTRTSTTAAAAPTRRCACGQAQRSPLRSCVARQRAAALCRDGARRASALRRRVPPPLFLSPNVSPSAALPLAAPQAAASDLSPYDDVPCQVCGSFNYDTAAAHGHAFKQVWSNQARSIDGSGLRGRGRFLMEATGVPWEKVPAFVEGESLRSGFAFHRIGVKRSGPEAGDGKWDFKSCTFGCPNRVQPRQVPDHLRRRSRGTRAPPMGTGCEARFVVSRQANGTATITYQVVEHNEACVVSRQQLPLGSTGGVTSQS